MIVKNWSLFVSNDDGYTAPELFHYHLQGVLYGHPDFDGGTQINTSRIVGIVDAGGHKVITTSSGSEYLVYKNDVDPECEKQIPNYYERLEVV